MKRDIILSAIIGLLVTYLPFWEWTGTGQQIFGAVGCGLWTFYILQRPRIHEWILK